MPATENGIPQSYASTAVWVLTILAKADREWADPVARASFQEKGIASKYQLAMAFALHQIFRAEGASEADAIAEGLDLARVVNGDLSDLREEGTES